MSKLKLPRDIGYDEVNHIRYIMKSTLRDPRYNDVVDSIIDSYLSNLIKPDIDDMNIVEYIRYIWQKHGNRYDTAKNNLMIRVDMPRKFLLQQGSKPIEQDFNWVDLIFTKVVKSFHTHIVTSIFCNGITVDEVVVTSNGDLRHDRFLVYQDEDSEG